MYNRRDFVKAAGCCSMTSAFSRNHSAWAASAEQRVELRLRHGAPLATIPEDFTGLGYEELSMAMPGLLTATNLPYVRLVQNLGKRGVVRAGGIVADFTRYQPDGARKSDAKDTILTRESLHELRSFLDAVNWDVIWSVNFGFGTVSDAIDEARDVASILGPRLLAIELGNEVENYAKGSQPRRKPSYSFEAYLAEYRSWRAAMLAAVPGLHFAAPDTAASIEWVERMAAEARGEVQLLTTHYYRGDQKLGTRDQLLQHDPGLPSKLEQLQRASKQSGIPWRMCETNSFFGGGRPGLSDAFAAALWTLDYMMLLAQYGCAGVNIETGINQLGFVSSYSPIRDDARGHTEVGPPYYGMLAFALATADSTDMLGLDLTSDARDFTAYALGQNGEPAILVLVNKSSERSLRVHLRDVTLRHATSMQLTAPSLDSTNGIALGGGSVSNDGTWNGAAEKISLYNNELSVPAASASVLRLHT